MHPVFYLTCKLLFAKMCAWSLPVILSSSASSRKFEFPNFQWPTNFASSIAGRLASVSDQEVRLVAPDGTTVLRKSAFKFALQNPAQNTTNVSVFGQVEFKEQGTYTIEVLIDEVMKLRVPVPVILVQQKQQPPKGAPPQAQ